MTENHADKHTDSYGDSGIHGDAPHGDAPHGDSHSDSHGDRTAHVDSHEDK